jgi:aminoglycoside 3-N-acetyltransferase I
MPASYTLKRLGADDVPLLRALNEMFGEAFKEPDTYTGAPPSDDYFKELLGNGDFVALVALKDDQGEKNVIAGLAGYMLRKFERARAELFVYDLAVREGFRRQGIATAMLE